MDFGPSVTRRGGQRVRRELLVFLNEVKLDLRREGGKREGVGGSSPLTKKKSAFATVHGENMAMLRGPRTQPLHAPEAPRCTADKRTRAGANGRERYL
ncbi:hypothetical protein F2P81_009444 [Scophthalmus maximus]|uniref:Uncharacterized protein n=1 Tax=Scophthalmus maximus TaxID=52904 RepID=A0A6A4T4N0_SCOMX|nr:hypothetical protein F2P81_009444 [Scophthalmus maximus]